MSQEVLRRIIHPEVKVLDAKQGIVEYVASDETIDSYAEVVLAGGWQFTQFQKNAPFVDSHDYTTIGKLVGRVLDFRVENKQLIETVKWAIDVPENTLAQMGFNMTQGGYLKAVSVGFFPVAGCSIYDSNPGAFQSLCAQLGLDPQKVRTIYTKQEQVELSSCIIGANPNALAKAMKDGCITERQVISLFQEPHEKTATTAPATGRAVAAPNLRAREWQEAERRLFLEKLERAYRA